MTVDTKFIPLFDLARGWPAIREDALAVFERIAESGAFSLGAELDAFEAEYAESVGTTHAIGVANGTVAIELEYAFAQADVVSPDLRRARPVIEHAFLLEVPQEARIDGRHPSENARHGRVLGPDGFRGGDRTDRPAWTAARSTPRP